MLFRSEFSGNLLKRISLKLHDYLTDYWIEGIGSTLGIIYSGNFAIDFSTDLLCATQKSTTIYNNPTYNDCYIYTGINSNTVPKIRIYPTIVQDYLYIESEKYPLRVFVTNIVGRVLISEFLANDKQLSCNSLPSGMYLCKIQIENENYYITMKFVKQ